MMFVLIWGCCPDPVMCSGSGCFLKKPRPSLVTTIMLRVLQLIWFFEFLMQDVKSRNNIRLSKENSSVPVNQYWKVSGSVSLDGKDQQHLAADWHLEVFLLSDSKLVLQWNSNMIVSFKCLEIRLRFDKGLSQVLITLRRILVRLQNKPRSSAAAKPAATTGGGATAARGGGLVSEAAKVTPKAPAEVRRAPGGVGGNFWLSACVVNTSPSSLSWLLPLVPLLLFLLWAGTICTVTVTARALPVPAEDELSSHSDPLQSLLTSRCCFFRTLAPCKD